KSTSVLRGSSGGPSLDRARSELRCLPRLRRFGLKDPSQGLTPVDRSGSAAGRHGTGMDSASYDLYFVPTFTLSRGKACRGRGGFFSWGVATDIPVFGPFRGKNRGKTT